MNFAMVIFTSLHHHVWIKSCSILYKWLQLERESNFDNFPVYPPPLRLPSLRTTNRGPLSRPLTNHTTTITIYNYHAQTSTQKTHTFQGTNISHLGKRKIIFKRPSKGDLLVPRRVPISVCPPHRYPWYSSRSLASCCEHQSSPSRWCFCWSPRTIVLGLSMEKRCVGSISTIWTCCIWWW